MNSQDRARIRELMFFVVPDPDEDITDDVLARTEEVDYDESQRLKAEFRSLIESMEEWPEERSTVLSALHEMDASSNDAPGNVVEWENVRDVMGRRIRKALARALSED
ncbi:MAG: hypothetical protein ABGZ53_12290 [Fuerstiella sp.]